MSGIAFILYTQWGIAFVLYTRRGIAFDYTHVGA